MRRKAGLIEDCETFIEGFAKNCKKVQSLENFLSFAPIHGKFNFFDILEPKSKIEQLKKLEMDHLKQLVKSEENSTEIESLLTSYNEVV